MSRKLKILISATGASVLFIGSLVILLAHWMGGSATGTVRVGNPTASTATTQKPAEALALDNGYFAASLPGGYVLKRTSDTPNADVYLFGVVADTASTTDQQFAATIGKMPTGGVSETGDYHLRATQTDTYQPYHPAYLPTGGMAFHSVSGPASITLFWPRSTTYGEISMSTEGGATESQLDTALQAILASWHWK